MYHRVQFYQTGGGIIRFRVVWVPDAINLQHPTNEIEEKEEIFYLFIKNMSKQITLVL